jgi:NAD(P) transhydrogenase
MIILGGGVIGCEYACIFAHLGIRVTLVDNRPALLKFIGREFSDAIAYHMRKAGITLHLAKEIENVELKDKKNVIVKLQNGKVLNAETLFYAVKRIGDTDSLNLSKINLNTDKRGHLKVNDKFQTKIPHIYAVGDVIGFPSLASTSMNQGRLAMYHVFSNDNLQDLNQILPFGIYTIPEISIVGETEKSLSEKNIPYEIGTAYYSEIARGLIIGDYQGILKIVFHPETLEILGVHIMGNNASELIHVAQTVMAFKGNLHYFIDTVFNVPTLSEAYKVAALNGYNKILESKS